MSTKKTCPDCGTELPPDAPAGVCPKCLLKAGIHDPSAESAEDQTLDSDSGTPADSPPIPPTQHSGTPAVSTPQIGAKIKYFGDYELLDEIARGGMGVVYRARQVRLNRTVALKMILSGQFAGEADVQRFQTEAEAAAQLDHPGIVPVYEVGEHEGHHFFSMGLVDGDSLAARIADGPLPAKEAAALVRRIADAIQYAHSKGVIHRDLKPANILLDEDSQPRVTDFGLAKRVQGDSNLTATGQALGTPSYMPPEQASGRIGEVKEPADIYSLGAVLYAALTGRPPFQADNSLDTLMQVLEREPIAPRQLNPGVPPDLETICLKCLQKDRRRRYGSMQELIDELDRFCDGRPILARPISRTQRAWRWCQRSPVVAGLTAALALALLAGTAVSTVFAVRANWEATQSASHAARAEKEADRATKQERLTRRYLYSAHMNLANAAWDKGNVIRVLELLDQHRPANGQEDLRSFEWRYLWNQCHRQRKKIVLSSRREVVSSLKISDNGRWIAVGPTDQNVHHAGGENSTFREVRLWDVTAAALRHTIIPKINPADKKPDERYVEAVFSPDGKLFAVVVYDHLMVWEGDASSRSGMRVDSKPRVVIRDLETMRVRTTIPLPDFRLLDHIAISPDNQRVAAGFTTKSDNGKKLVQNLRVWNIPVEEKTPAGDPIFSKPLGTSSPGYTGLSVLTFGADSTSIFWAKASDQSVTMTNILDGKDAAQTFNRWGFKVSPTGEHFASANSSQVQLFDAKAEEAAHTFSAANIPNSQPLTAFSPDGRILATTRGLTIDLWDVESKKQMGELCGTTDRIRAIAFGADSKTLVSVANNKFTDCLEASVWDVNTRIGPDEFSVTASSPMRFDPVEKKKKPHSLTGLSVSSDGRWLVSHWEWAFSQPFGSHALNLLDMSSDARERLLHLKWDLDDPDIRPQQFSPSSAAFSRDGKQMAVVGPGVKEVNGVYASRETHIQLWRLEGDRSESNATLEQTIFAPSSAYPNSSRAVFSPDGTMLAYAKCPWSFNTEHGSTSRGDDTLQLYDISRQRTTQLPADPELWFADHDGLAMRNVSDSVLWDGRITGIVFSSDGKRVFTGSDIPWQNHRTRIVAWNITTAKPLAVLEAPEQQGLRALSLDNRTLATVGTDHSIQLWDVSEKALQGVAIQLKQQAEAVRNGTAKGKNKPATEPRVTLRGHAAYVTSVAFHPDGKILATASRDGTLKLWDVATGEVRLTLEGHQANITTLTFTPDGNSLISADNSGLVKRWRATATGERTPENLWGSK